MLQDFHAWNPIEYRGVDYALEHLVLLQLLHVLLLFSRQVLPLTMMLHALSVRFWWCSENRGAAASRAPPAAAAPAAEPPQARPAAPQKLSKEELGNKVRGCLEEYFARRDKVEVAQTVKAGAPLPSCCHCDCHSIPRLFHPMAPNNHRPAYGPTSACFALHTNTANSWRVMWRHCIDYKV